MHEHINRQKKIIQLYEPVKVIRKVTTRLPTAHGLYNLYYYENNQDKKEHLALVMGEVTNVESVLLRIHSECFTGDVFSSRRCDCGYQLNQAMRIIEQEQKGIIIYLRQEGRGIGLLAKLQAYNLQDQGFDTVEANLKLGHQVDERDYRLAGAILKDLGVKSVRLMTNNPHKLRELIAYGITIENRMPLESPAHEDNFRYLHTKKIKMNHLLTNYNLQPLSSAPKKAIQKQFQTKKTNKSASHDINITLSYAQSIDGCIALKNNETLALSSPDAQRLTHYLRSQHDAILVGIGTVLTDNPCLTVRLVAGRNPQPVILDTWLRIPGSANLLHHPNRQPIIFCSPAADPEKKLALEKAGAYIKPVPLDRNNLLDLKEIFTSLKSLGIHSLMVEGGSKVITSFLTAQAVDEFIITMVPQILGGLSAITALPDSAAGIFPAFEKVTYQKLGEEIIIKGVFKKT